MELSLTDMTKFYTFLEYIQSLTNIQPLDQSRSPILFRGHGNFKWDLRPKICRIAEELPLGWRLEYEFDSVTFFKHHAHRYLSPNSIPTGNLTVSDSFAEWVSIMQHHGAPTRLIDWTSSVNVALYFAALDQPDEDGALWYFDQKSLLEAAPPFGLSDDQEDKIFDDCVSFVNFGLSVTSPTVRVFNSQIKFDRMAAQHSLFTVSDHVLSDHRQLIGKFLWDKYATTIPANLLVCIKIPSIIKPKIRAHLSKIGVSAGTLFPGVDGLGRTVQEIFEIHEAVHILGADKLS